MSTAKPSASVVSALGGQERLIAKSGNDPHYSPDGTRIVYWVGEPANFYSSGKVYVVPSTGGKPTEINPGFADARYPNWTPDGKHILFQGLDLPKGKPDWWIAPAGEDGPSQDKCIKTGAFDRFQHDGLSVHMGPGGFRGNWIFFSANAGNTRSIYKVQISTGDWKVEQAPKRLTFGTALEVQPSPGPDSRLAFVSLNFSVGVWSLPINGLGRSTIDIQRLTEGRAFDGTPSSSRDGKRVVFTCVGSLGSRDIWLKDFQTDRETALTATAADEISSVMSPDGLKVAYSLSAFPEQIYVMDLGMSPGSSVGEKVCDNCGAPVGWTPDGMNIIYVYGRPRSIGTLALASSRKTQLLHHTEYDLDQAQFSPDGAWISVVEHTGPDYTVIYVVPFRNGTADPESQWIRITSGGAWEDLPRWSTDGKLIYFYSKRDGYGCIWQQLLDPSTRRPVGPPSAVHHFHSSRLSLMHMALNRIGISVTPDRLIFNLIENTGNIWILQEEPK
jgi:Tol biopolymer transport system component